LLAWLSFSTSKHQSYIPKCKFIRFDAILHQECDNAFSLALENYTQNLRKYFADRNEPFEVQELFEILKEVRDNAIDEFSVSGEVREKYKDYEDYLTKMQEYISKQEEMIIQINENLAEK
jgi:hypothetical protein